MSEQSLAALRRGVVIPAHPLALTFDRKLDERRQRALTRYYLAAGAEGVAVGVHTTQFAIREPSVGLLRPVLELAVEEVGRFAARQARPVVRVAGVCGRTAQAVGEAGLARELGYDLGLLSLAAMKDDPVDALLAHCRAVAEVMPVMGFYLQPAVGGRLLPAEFWRGFAAIENVVAIKMAPFNRYHTFDVVRGVAEAGRAGQIALYTGNDDNILADLLTPYTVAVSGRSVTQRIVGGLLGHWSVWTRRAVEQLDAIHQIVDGGNAGSADTESGSAGLKVAKATVSEATVAEATDAVAAVSRTTIPQVAAAGATHSGAAILNEWLGRGIEVTDCNAAFFDAANGFAGCIAGLHEVLRRQGLFEGIWCLDPNETLSPGQADEIDRVYRAYPHLNDDTFVREHRDEWLG